MDLKQEERIALKAIDECAGFHLAPPPHTVPCPHCAGGGDEDCPSCDGDGFIVPDHGFVTSFSRRAKDGMR